MIMNIFLTPSEDPYRDPGKYLLKRYLDPSGTHPSPTEPQRVLGSLGKPVQQQNRSDGSEKKTRCVFIERRR